MQIKKLSLVVMAAQVLTLGLAGCGNAKDTTTSGKANAAAAVVVEQGKLAPDFTVQMLDGSQVKLSSLRGKPVFLNFWATWCPPCKVIAPILDDLAKEYKGQIYIYKVDVDKEPQLASAFGIQSIPTLLFVPMTGDPRAEVGAITKETFKDRIDNFMLAIK